MTAEIVTIGLTARFVYWKDLGVDIHKERELKQAANTWPAIDEWLNEHISGEWRSSANGIWFLNGGDAMLFKLTWAGRII